MQSDNTKEKEPSGGVSSLIRWAVIIALPLLLVGLIGVAAWAVWPLLTMPEQNTEPHQAEQVTELQLPEQVQLRDVVLADTVQPKPEDFVTGLEGTEITVSFETVPDSTVGKQTVTLKFTAGSAVCTRQSTLQVFHLEQTVSGIMGQTERPDIRDYVAEKSVDAAFVGLTPEQIPSDQCGKIKLTIACAGREYEVIYSIEERIAPQGTAVRVETESGKLPDPATLVTDIVDHSEVTVTYLQEPDLSMVGSVAATVVLTDAYGNTTNLETVIDVIPAAGAPYFKGLRTLYVRLGCSATYKTGVKALDEQDGEVNFTVNAGDVNRGKEGAYTAYYTATDSEGNTTIVPRKVIVQKVDKDLVEEYAKKVLSKIITEGMTRDQKIQAVFRYSRYNVSYVGFSDKSGMIYAAFEGFAKGQGDCYTYHCMNVIMLDLLGIENLSVKRMNGETNHWWNLVQFEDGKYYHVDSTPSSVIVEGINKAKMTDTDLETYSSDAQVRKRRANYYLYDKTLPEYEGIEIAP